MRAFVRLPHLPLVLLGQDLDSAGPIGVVLDAHGDGSFVPRAVTRLVDVSPAAAREGVRVGMRTNDAQRLCPQLRVQVVRLSALCSEVRLLAEVLLSVVPAAQPLCAHHTDRVVCGVVCDVSRMTVPPEHLLLHMQEHVQRAGHACVVVAAPTVRLARAASHRIARGGGRTRVWIDDAHKVLGILDVPSLELLPDQEETLRALGVTTATQLRALCSTDGGDRLGDAAQQVRSLWSALSRAAPEPVDSITPPVVIEERIEFDDPMSSVEPLMFVLSRLCGRALLRTVARHERVAEMELVLWRRRGLPPTTQKLVFPAPLDAPEPAVRAWHARLERLQLETPFDGVIVRVVSRAPGANEQLSLDPRQRATQQNDRALLHWMTEVQAELGADRAGTLSITTDVRPERMTAVAWPPRRPPAVRAPPARRRVRPRQSAFKSALDAPTAEGRFLASWPWPTRLFAAPERLPATLWRDVVRRELLGVLEGEDSNETPFARRYLILHLSDGRRALASFDPETEEHWLCGWFD